MSGRRVLVVALGGTIAMTGDPDTGVAPTLDATSLVAAVPGLRDAAAVETLNFRSLPGAHIAFDDVGTLAGVIREALSDHDGVVVTQGTDTIEETAFALDLLLPSGGPVVVTGAMRNPTLAGADGPANVLAATRAAASPAARGLGVLVVMADEVHAARFVSKRHTQSTAAFSSLAGPLGWVSEGDVRIVLTPAERWDPIPAGTGRERVALVTASMDDGDLLRAVDLAASDGLVVEAMGGGHVSAAAADALSDAAATIPVVLTSRTGSGEGLRRSYAFPGSERDLLERGLLSAGWLDGPKARVLMTLLLRAGLDRAAIAAWLERHLSDGGAERHRGSA